VLAADEGALQDMRLLNLRLKGGRAGQWMPRCGPSDLNCVTLTDGVVIVLQTLR
jgi:hypothetical protein